MTLNFYGHIKQYTDGEKEYKLSLSVIDLSDDQAVELKRLKRAGLISFVATSATIEFETEVDAENASPRYRYYKDASGKWLRDELEEPSLDLDGIEQYTKHHVRITADIVDRFVLSQQVEYFSSFPVKQVLGEIIEGYDFTQISEHIAMPVGDIIAELQKARIYFAPFAAQWWKQQEEAGQ